MLARGSYAHRPAKSLRRAVDDGVEIKEHAVEQSHTIFIFSMMVLMMLLVLGLLFVVGAGAVVLTNDELERKRVREEYLRTVDYSWCTKPNLGDGSEAATPKQPTDYVFSKQHFKSTQPVKPSPLEATETLPTPRVFPKPDAVQADRDGVARMETEQDQLPHGNHPSGGLPPRPLVPPSRRPLASLRLKRQIAAISGNRPPSDSRAVVSRPAIKKRSASDVGSSNGSAANSSVSNVTAVV